MPSWDYAIHRKRRIERNFHVILEQAAAAKQLIDKIMEEGGKVSSEK